MYRFLVYLYSKYFVGHQNRLLNRYLLTTDAYSFPCDSMCTKIQLAHHLSVLELLASKGHFKRGAEHFTEIMKLFFLKQF